MTDIGDIMEPEQQKGPGFSATPDFLTPQRETTIEIPLTVPPLNQAPTEDYWESVFEADRSGILPVLDAGPQYQVPSVQTMDTGLGAAFALHMQQQNEAITPAVVEPLSYAETADGTIIPGEVELLDADAPVDGRREPRFDPNDPNIEDAQIVDQDDQEPELEQVEPEVAEVEPEATANATSEQDNEALLAEHAALRRQLELQNAQPPQPHAQNVTYNGAPGDTTNAIHSLAMATANVVSGVGRGLGAAIGSVLTSPLAVKDGIVEAMSNKGGAQQDEVAPPTTTAARSEPKNVTPVQTAPEATTVRAEPYIGAQQVAVDDTTPPVFNATDDTPPAPPGGQAAIEYSSGGQENAVVLADTKRAYQEHAVGLINNAIEFNASAEQLMEQDSKGNFTNPAMQELKEAHENYAKTDSYYGDDHSAEAEAARDFAQERIDQAKTNLKEDPVYQATQAAAEQFGRATENTDLNDKAIEEIKNQAEAEGAPKSLVDRVSETLQKAKGNMDKFSKVAEEVKEIAKRIAEIIERITTILKTVFGKDKTADATADKKAAAPASATPEP